MADQYDVIIAGAGAAGAILAARRAVRASSKWMRNMNRPEPR